MNRKTGKGEHKKEEKNNRNKNLTERVDSTDKLKKRGQSNKLQLDELKIMKNKGQRKLKLKAGDENVRRAVQLYMKAVHHSGGL